MGVCVNILYVLLYFNIYVNIRYQYNRDGRWVGAHMYNLLTIQLVTFSDSWDGGRD